MEPGSHRVDLPTLLPQRSRLEASIRRAAALAPEERSALLSALALLPHEQSLCHGDFHPARLAQDVPGERDRLLAVVRGHRR